MLSVAVVFSGSFAATISALPKGDYAGIATGVKWSAIGLLCLDHGRTLDFWRDSLTLNAERFA